MAFLFSTIIVLYAWNTGSFHRIALSVRLRSVFAWGTSKRNALSEELQKKKAKTSTTVACVFGEKKGTAPLS